jgi:GTP cyclohydrolase II
MNNANRNKTIELAVKAASSVSQWLSIKKVNPVRHRVVRKGVGPITMLWGRFWLYDFEVSDHWKNYRVLWYGKVDQNLWPVFTKDQLFLRIDSGCETGQIFNDLTCECRAQLGKAILIIKKNSEGMIINIPAQDGRGLGLPFKLGTMLLENALGMDTVEAAHTLAKRLGLEDKIDVRSFEGIILILKALGLPVNTKINLITNNPKKAEIFAQNGYKVVGLTPVVIKPNSYTKKHLQAKQSKLGHLNLVP